MGSDRLSGESVSVSGEGAAYLELHIEHEASAKIRRRTSAISARETYPRNAIPLILHIIECKTIFVEWQ